jgi:hypothetical protein
MLIVVSDFPEARTEIIDGIEYHFTTDHSYSKSAFIELVKLEPKFKYYFFLPDTCSLGPNFFGLTRYFEDEDWDVVLPTLNGIMSFGAYNHSFLLRIKDFINSLINLSKQEEVWNKYTFMAHARPDKIGRYPNYLVTKELGYEDTYKTGTKHRITYYAAVDVTKYSANWGEGSDAVPGSWHLEP